MQKGPVISIVDDDKSVCVAIGSLVRSLGFVAYTFPSAEEFLQSPHLDNTACVVTDVQMPGMSGVELQRRLRAIGRDIPMIFITAFPDEKIRARVLEAGAICFLNKPFDGKSMIECLDTALKKHDGGAMEP